MSRWLIAIAVGLIAVAGCGKTALEDLKEGETFEMGELRYNVLFSRDLNPADTEDADYLVGQPPAPGGKRYFGVFLLIDNRGSETVTLPKKTDFEMTDTTGATYQPLDSKSPFAFPYGGTVPGDSQLPDPDSIAAGGPIQGSLILFLVDDAVTNNRPLKLHISSQGEEATVELDL